MWLCSQRCQQIRYEEASKAAPGGGRAADLTACLSAPPGRLCAPAAGPKATDEASVFRYHPAFKFGEPQAPTTPCLAQLGFQPPPGSALSRVIQGQGSSHCCHCQWHTMQVTQQWAVQQWGHLTRRHPG